MAPIVESKYFPPLDKCLNGDELLISWKSVLCAIKNSSDFGSDSQTAIETFLADSEVLELLSKPFEAFPESSSKTKTAFETKTSAINVTPSSTARYDIKAIKDDALWLSKSAQLDEVSALRIVVEEYQTQASSQLLGPFSEEELAGIREVAGNTTYLSPIPVSLLSHGVEPKAFEKEFNTQSSRRQRILHTYLSERQHFLKCTEQLFHTYFKNDAEKDSGKGKGIAIGQSWLERCGNGLISKIGSINVDDYFLRCVRAITTNIENLQTGSGWFEEDGGRAEIELEWVRSQITEATHTMEIIWQFLRYRVEFPSSQIVLEWFRLQQSCGFFDNLELEDPAIQALLEPLQSISVIISVAILKLVDSLEWLNDPENQEEVSSTVAVDKPFIFNTQTLIEIHAVLLNAADVGFITAGPPILAWSILLHTMSGRIEFDKSRALDGEYSRFDRQSSVETDSTLTPVLYEDVMTQIRGTLDDDPVDFLARKTVNSCHVFQTLSSISSSLGSTSNAFFSEITGAQMRITILDLLRSSSGVGYIPEIIEAAVSALVGGQSYWDILDSTKLGSADDPILRFLQDGALIDFFLGTAQSRFPCEALPFLQLLRALSACSSTYSDDNALSVLTFLERLPRFTYTLPVDFVGYETTQEEDNNNNIRLTQPVQLFEPRKAVRTQVAQNRSFALVRADEDFCIPAGTSGRIISESGPRIAFWFHEYSGLKYFGKLLETFLASSDQVDATTQMPADRDSVSEIIEILATLLLGIARSADSNPNSKEDARRVLEIASSGLNRNHDITTVVFDIFDAELQNQSAFSGPDVPLEVLVSCVHFIHALVPISPGRVWPFLSRSGLLGVSRGSGRLPRIVESVELLSGRYDLLISCCRLYESLVDDYANNSVKRRSAGKSSARFNSEEDIGTGIPDQIVSKIFLAFTGYMVDVLESACTWKFLSNDDRRYLSKAIGSTLNKILQYVYGIESSAEPGLTAQNSMESGRQKVARLSEALLPSASHIVENFLSTSPGTLRYQPLLRSYFDGLDTPDFTVFSNQTKLRIEEVETILFFSKTLLRVGTTLELPTSQLEIQLFKVAPLIARLYAANDGYQNAVVTLFEALVTAASNNASEPPSLLGHLGPQTAKNFLHMLSNLDKPLSREGRLSLIWRFLSVVVSSRQQWFANYLLTGKTPREALNHKTPGKELASLDRSLLVTALEVLSKIKEIPQVHALAVLEFVALAQNFWPWTVCASPKYPEFITSLSEFVGNLSPLQSFTDIAACHQTRIAAYIAEILSMHLFHSRQMGNYSTIKDLIPNLSYFWRFAVAAPTYNTSLHTQLKRNFEARYPGSHLLDLKRTTLEYHQYGTEYFYDLHLADKMLGFDQAWTGRKDDGLRVEICKANINLSLVDAQIALFHSWKFLSIELSSNLKADEELQKILGKVAVACLHANSRSQPPEEIFSRLSQTRADFAIVLAQRLVQANSSVSEVKDLLSVTWETIRTLRGQFDRSVPENEVVYYRSLLKLLFIALRVHAEVKPPTGDEKLRVSFRATQSTTVIPFITDILKFVVSMGLRELAATIHESPADSSPEDLALITGIMQSCLRVPGTELCQPQIVAMMISNSTPRVALTLFSWSDKLAIEGDPIYGELSILFLLELSSMPLMAEQLAIDGVLGAIASASITSYLRRSGVGPFADGTGLQRCYSIWARGILPLLLNLLDAVQASIAGEVAIFLNQFQTLLTQSEQAFDAPETNRIIAKGQPKYISLTICSEVHSLALLAFILNGFRETLGNSTEIPVVKWDAAGVLENVEFWLGSRGLLKERILPMGEVEVGMARKKDGALVSRLEEKVVAELNGIRDVLSGGDSS